MFFKAVFALYLATIALAAPLLGFPPGTFRVNLCPLCTSLLLTVLDEDFKNPDEQVT